jgi:hypothetical protein
VLHRHFVFDTRVKIFVTIPKPIIPFNKGNPPVYLFTGVYPENMAVSRFVYCGEYTVEIVRPLQRSFRPGTDRSSKCAALGLISDPNTECVLPITVQVQIPLQVWDFILFFTNSRPGAGIADVSIAYCLTRDWTTGV